MLGKVDEPEPYQCLISASQELLLFADDIDQAGSLLDEADMHDCLVANHHRCVMLQHLDLGFEFQYWLWFGGSVQQHRAPSDIVAVELVFDWFDVEADQLSGPRRINQLPLSVDGLYSHELIASMRIWAKIALLLKPNLSCLNQPGHNDTDTLDHESLHNVELERLSRCT